MLQIFEVAEGEAMPTYRAADRVAERRITSIGKLQQNYV
jgi:hypothetical protein